MIIVMCMAMLRSVDIIRSLFASVAVSTCSMAVRMIMEQYQAQDIRTKTQAAHKQHEPWLCDWFRGYEPLDCIEENGHTKCDQKDSIYEGSQCLCPLPPVCICLGATALIGHCDRLQTDAQ